ncbi:hypothetical protein SERLA73DRAFT_80032 [Serpula lacrymans var. lacrymans S7.3]|uniref:Uncharacterized protein n=1 Tax=Serpula lacrymans var. lacrymans (strain S7.3) TaxID=936435 RepID=F8QIF7_SERL3|nr:hypothetical protein SERLA73DRAFT_80032 [Serpula lacrymans var. lacrymans S7.3]
MGSLCSKSRSHSGGHQVLGGAPAGYGATSAGGGRTAGSQPPSSSADPRAAAAEAAERRLKSEQTRGTNVSNPKRGHLAAKVEAAKGKPVIPEAKKDEPLVVSFPPLSSPRLMSSHHHHPCYVLQW